MNTMTSSLASVGRSEPSRLLNFAASRIRALAPIAVLAVLYLIAIAIAPGYLEATQLGALLQLSSILGIVAIGQTLVILIGGIDLSVGAVATLANLSAGALINSRNENIPLAIAATLAIGLVCGGINGVVIALLKVPDLVATLATMTAIIGVGYLVTNGSPKGSSSPALNEFVTERFAGVLSAGVVLWIVLSVVTIVLLSNTAGGRKIYAVGLNREASRFAAISSKRVVITLYVFSGLTASIAGLLLTGFTGSSFLGSGAQYQLASIAAVVLGGVSIFGGRGGYGGALVGVLITTLLLSVLQIAGISESGQNLAYGVVILIMLIVFTARRKANF
jgi:ribose transport system permease protein